MSKELRIVELENRLHKLQTRDKDNNGVQRKIIRELRNLKK